MATMYPPTWDDVNDSRAERHVYRRLRDETPADWFAVHSVGLTGHEHKSWAEIDFVVVGPFGVLCLEVKGGVVRVEHGAWSTNHHALRESPFQQAGGACAPLRRELKTRFRCLRRALVEFAVLFPDTHFRGDGAGIERAILYDQETVGLPFDAWIGSVVGHWRREKGLLDGRFRPLSPTERSAVVDWLAPTVDAIPSLASRIADSEAVLHQLTGLQARALRGMRTKDRAFLRGGAGTGKTLLAVEEAERLAAEGRRVLFCCRSRHLASFIRDAVRSDGVDVVDVESLMRDRIAQAGTESEIPDADTADLFSIFLPELAAEATIMLDREGSYDALVLDEAQDLLLEAILDLFDILLDGGLEGGCWRVFLDHKQNVFSAVDAAQLDRIRGSAVTEHDLVDNCRNTAQIATTTAMMSAVTPDEIAGGDGPDVDVRFVARSRIISTAAAIAAAWRTRGVDDVIILGESNDVPAPARRALTAHGLVAREHPASPGPSQVRWCRLEDFKGLEATAVVVTGITDLSRAEMLRRAYVACSRARTLLAVVLPEELEEAFGVRAAEFMRLQAGSEPT